MQLTEISYESIKIGLRIISDRGTAGYVSEKYERFEDTAAPEKWIQCIWENGNISDDEISAFNTVKIVKN